MQSVLLKKTYNKFASIIRFYAQTEQSSIFPANANSRYRLVCWLVPLLRRFQTRNKNDQTKIVCSERTRGLCANARTESLQPNLNRIVKKVMQNRGPFSTEFVDGIFNEHEWLERKGVVIVEIPIQYRERLGEKKLGVKHAAEILRRMMLEAIY